MFLSRNLEFYNLNSSPLD
uniref:Uncharacterized protein n=1 Tax=Rhizophora mucronata TaxID=61149 RepID=A0A2P2N112_RHIMU